ncbi:Kinase superfamily protein [Hibiscus syriacus]|uniref:Kinase superfamily protein n=2 Tax=Hibiscus syriacus TaxID=106335 RepID=A0A6A3CTR1_HIBSY|nr:Kinase superfamily protein [Hibiscus syriacus]
MMRGGSQLPVSIPAGNPAKKERGASRSGVFPLAEIWIHAIPVVVLICFFTLWWMSRPVNVEMEDGRIVAIHHVEMPLPLSKSHIDVSLLASPIAPLPVPPENGTVIRESSFLASD